MESTLAGTFSGEETADRIIIFMKRTEWTNCTAVEICVHENAEEQSEMRYFPESRHVCKWNVLLSLRAKSSRYTYLKSLS